MAKILLAEDDEIMVALLTTLLKMDGFEVATMEADEDVAAALERHSPEFLILDVHLSRQNGMDVVETLRKTHGSERLRVIMMSGLNVKDQALMRGADAFLLKPFMPDDLMKVLRSNTKAQA